MRAIAPVAGGGPFGTCPGDPVSAVIMHGMNDLVVPFTQGEGSRDTWRSDAGCEADRRVGARRSATADGLCCVPARVTVLWGRATAESGISSLGERPHGTR